jgi:PPK2 family polyphosphate:nucleotide phosphotransferase
VPRRRGSFIIVAGPQEATMKKYRVKPGVRLDLDDHDPDHTGDYRKAAGKARARRAIAELGTRLAFLQERLYANGDRALLVVLQGMDTSGKDGTIKNVMRGVNPQGCHVVSFKAPSAEELAHDFLWRVHRQVPARGKIGVFNRSHYEDVLVPRVHGQLSKRDVKQRFEQIRAFEDTLHASGTTIVKFFLNISRDEQRERLEARIRDPEKRWKWNSRDLDERKLWNDYLHAFEDAIGATSTDAAPWYIVPANRKWYRDVVVAQTLVATLEEMKLKCPPAPKGVDWDKLKID